MRYDEILGEIAISEYLQNRSTPLAVIYVPKLSIAYFLAKIVSAYSPFLFPRLPFEATFLPEEYGEKESYDLIYYDPVEEGYPSDLHYEDSYTTIIISQDGDYPEIKIETIDEKKVKKHRKREELTPDEKAAKKERRMLLILNLLVAALLAYGYLKGLQIAVLALVAGAIVVFDYIFLNRKKWAEQRKAAMLEEEFVEIFSYFSIYVKNGLPSYAALEGVIPFSSLLMGEKLENLLAEIDEDKTVMPYVRFGDNFRSLEIKQVLIAIFKMAEEGGSEAYIRQFDTLFSALSNNARRAGIDKKKSKLETMGFLPLVGSAIAMMMIILAVAIMLQEMS